MKFISGLTITALVITNLYTGASNTAHSALNGLLNAIPYVNHYTDKPDNRAATQKRLLKRLTKRVAVRTARNVGIDFVTAAGKATPYIGIGLVVAATAIDINDGYDTIKDLNEIMAVYGEPPIMELPQSPINKMNDAIGGTVYYSVENVKSTSAKVYDAIGGTIYYIFN